MFIEFKEEPLLEYITLNGTKIFFLNFKLVILRSVDNTYPNILFIINLNKKRETLVYLFREFYINYILKAT